MRYSTPAGSALDVTVNGLLRAASAQGGIQYVVGQGLPGLLGSGVEFLQFGLGDGNRKPLRLLEVSGLPGFGAPVFSHGANIMVYRQPIVNRRVPAAALGYVRAPRLGATLTGSPILVRTSSYTSTSTPTSGPISSETTKA